MNMTLTLPTRNSIIETNRQIVEKTGEPFGFHYEAGLDAALYSLTYYSTAYEIGIALLYKIAKNHIFINGNKRTAVWVATDYLALADLSFPDSINLAFLTIEITESGISLEGLFSDFGIVPFGV
jgi:death-on-curing family protein